MSHAKNPGATKTNALLPARKDFCYETSSSASTRPRNLIQAVTCGKNCGKAKVLPLVFLPKISHFLHQIGIPANRLRRGIMKGDWKEYSIRHTRQATYEESVKDQTKGARSGSAEGNSPLLEHGVSPYSPSCFRRCRRHTLQMGF